MSLLNFLSFKRSVGRPPTPQDLKRDLARYYESRCKKLATYTQDYGADSSITRAERAHVESLRQQLSARAAA